MLDRDGFRFSDDDSAEIVGALLGAARDAEVCGLRQRAFRLFVLAFRCDVSRVCVGGSPLAREALVWVRRVADVSAPGVPSAPEWLVTAEVVRARKIVPAAPGSQSVRL